MKEKILGLLFATVGLIAVSCTQNWEIPEDVAEEIAVTFSISTEGQMIRSRADGIAFGENDEKKCSTISDGKKVDRVVYALYIYDAEKGNYRLLEQFGDNYGKSEDDIDDNLGPGQAFLPSTKELQSEEGETLTLRLMRGQEYVIAFWAQNSACEAYNTKDLEHVVVNYKANDEGVLAPNNDEIRDAFCVAMSFTATVDQHVYVVLKRAMAQINVGTAGWDYNAEVVWGNCYAYSKVVMTGIKNQLNVLTGELDTAGEFDGTVTYDWAKLPAYNGIDYPSDFPDDEHQDFAEWLKDPKLDREFLYVKLRDDKKWSDYTTDIPEKFSDKITEVFKYLSMCYVLAPVAPQKEETSQVQNAAKVGNEETNALVINQLDFYLAESVPTGTEEGTQIFSITQVPFQRNWRTNILGGVRGSETSLFDPHAYSLKVDIRPCYFNEEHNYKDPGPDVGNEEHKGDIE